MSRRGRETTSRPRKPAAPTAGRAAANDAGGAAGAGLGAPSDAFAAPWTGRAARGDRTAPGARAGRGAEATTPVDVTTEYPAIRRDLRQLVLTSGLCFGFLFVAAYFLR